MEGIATDTDSLFPYWDRPIVRMQPHSITRDTFFRTKISTHLFPSKCRTNVQEQPCFLRDLLSLSSGGWMERGGSLFPDKAQFDKGIDVRGKATLSQITEHGSNGKFLWIGDMDFLRNGILTEFPVILSSESDALYGRRRFQADATGFPRSHSNDE